MEFILAVFLFTLTACITPGPNNIMVMTSALNYGVKNTFPHYLGICLGFPSMFLAVGFGLGTLFTQEPLFHQVIKICGIGYLFFLAWKIASASTDKNKPVSSKPFTFLQAAVFQWINPKAWVMTVGAIATYTTIDGAIGQQILLITLIFLLVIFPSVAVWLYFGAGLQKLLTKPLHQRIFNISMAALLIISVLPMSISQIEKIFT